MRRLTEVLRRSAWLRIAGVLYLVVAAVGKTWYSLPRLLRDVEPWSALDLRYRYNEVHAWFAGSPVYGVVDGAVYPPATHLILWPFLGWLPFAGARTVWAATTVAAAAVAAGLLYRLAAAAPVRDRPLLAGLALACYPLHIGLGVGQMGMHVAACALAGAALLVPTPVTLTRDAAGALLLAGALAKPTVSLPIVLTALIVAGRARPAVLLVAIYGTLSLAAAGIQPSGLLDLFRDWLQVASVRVPIEDGVPNLQLLLWSLGLKAWMTPAALVALTIAVAWTWRMRHTEPWILLGVAALVSRFWAHSTLYDDAILLLPALALFQIAFVRNGDETDRKSNRQGRALGGREVVGWLFAGAWAALLTPTWAYYGLGVAVLRALHAAQAVLWLAVLGFLMLQAHATATGPGSERASPHRPPARGPVRPN